MITLQLSKISLVNTCVCSLTYDVLYQPNPPHHTYDVYQTLYYFVFILPRAILSALIHDCIVKGHIQRIHEISFEIGDIVEST